MKLFKQILMEKNEAEEVSKLRQGIEELKKTQSAIDQMPDNKIKTDLYKKLNNAIKQLSDKEKKLSSKSSPKPSADVTPPPQQNQGQSQQPAKTATAQQTQQAKPNAPSAVATPPQQSPASTQTSTPQAKQSVPPPAEEAPKPSAVATPPQPQAAAQPAAKAEPPTEEEKTMLQKLHKSSYDPNSSMDKRNLDILRQARQEVGKDANLKTLANAVYAKQYAKGDAQKKGTANVQPTAQQPASAPAPATAPQLNVPEIKNQSVQAVQQMKAPQEPFKMQAPQQTGTLAQGPTNAAAQQTQKQQTAQQPVAAPQQQAPTKTAESTPNPFVRDLSKVGSAFSKSVQNMYGGANKSQQQVTANQKPAKPEASEEEANEENCEDCENNCEKCKKNKSKALNKITVQEKVNISKFLKHLSEKNYSSAHKYLKAIVDDKVNAKIAQRIAKI